MESESNSSCSLQCVKSSVVEQSATNEGNLPNMKNYPTLAQLKRDPNSLEMSPFSVALTSIYYNNGLVCPTKTELQCKFSKLEIVLPDSSCFVHPAEVPRRISFNSIQGAHYMLSSAFNGLLIHLSSNPLPANQQTVASLDQAQQNVASKESTSGQYLLLILKSPLRLELVQRLKLLFEYLNFIRNTISFIRDDRAAVFNFYKEWETDKTKLARCSSGIGASSAANSALVKAFNNSGNAARNGNTVTLYTYTRDKTIIPITSADVRCLNPDEFLNDTIIDFYCNWLLDRYLTEPEQRNRVYLFNSFFYKTYTQVKNPPKPTASEVASGKGGAVAVKVKRHERVKKWTKNVNLFEKDFIIIPVNEEWHWFLVLICFPKQAINASAHNGKTLWRYKTLNLSINSVWLKIQYRHPLSKFWLPYFWRPIRAKDALQKICLCHCHGMKKKYISSYGILMFYFLCFCLDTFTFFAFQPWWPVKSRRQLATGSTPARLHGSASRSFWCWIL